MMTMTMSTMILFLVLHRTPPAEAALQVVTYLQFPIQVCFPCIGQPVTDTGSVTDNLVVLVIVMI